jgi:alpha-L-rhamnosidase
MRLEIPPNTTATVYVPGSRPDEVKEAGKPAATATGVRFVQVVGGAAIFRIGSGKYRFESRI